ncbi:MAG: hypothetical protein RL197_286 [Actinomycetota bacterium]
MKKWLNWVALVLVFSVACGFLANWQLERRELKLSSIALVTDNYNQAPIPAAELFDANSPNLKTLYWRSVLITGSYQADKLLLVRNRPNNGQPGFEQLVPFLSTDGKTYFVTRGWLPTGSKQDSPDSNPVPPKGQLEIEARILVGEQLLDRSAPKGQIATINIQLAEELTGLRSSIPAYLRVAEEAGSKPAGLTPMPTPSIEEGNNLSYAVQWVLFALMAAAALIWRIRRDSAIESGSLRQSRKKQSDLDAAAEDEATRAK